MENRQSDGRAQDAGLQTKGHKLVDMPEGAVQQCGQSILIMHLHLSHMSLRVARTDAYASLVC
eukprot:318281-Pelagomonas_calceolata.AAC.5